MPPRPSGRRAILTFLLLAAAIPAASQPVVHEPVRLPASVLAAPAIGARLDRMFASAVAVLRRQAPPGVRPDEIDSFLSRHATRLRALVAEAFAR